VVGSANLFELKGTGVLIRGCRIREQRKSEGLKGLRDQRDKKNQKHQFGGGGGTLWLSPPGKTEISMGNEGELRRGEPSCPDGGVRNGDLSIQVQRELTLKRWKKERSTTHKGGEKKWG